jgi:hypothetical protein
MSDLQRLIDLLKSDNPNQRYDACEQLRVSRHSLSQAAIDALSSATHDSNLDVADAARRALALHAPQLKLDAVTEKAAGDKAATDAVTAARGGNLAIGFFGWILFHNIYFLLGGLFDFFASDIGSLVFVISPFVIVLVLVVLTKKAWIGVGSVIAILTSTVIWVSLGYPILVFLFPFPVGLGFFAQ